MRAVFGHIGRLGRWKTLLVHKGADKGDMRQICVRPAARIDDADFDPSAALGVIDVHPHRAVPPARASGCRLHDGSAVERAARRRRFAQHNPESGVGNGLDECNRGSGRDVHLRESLILCGGLEVPELAARILEIEDHLNAG